MQLKAFPIISNWEYIFSVKFRDKEEMKLARKPSLVYAPERSLSTHPELREKIVTEFAPQNNLLCLSLLNSISRLR